MVVSRSVGMGRSSLRRPGGLMRVALSALILLATGCPDEPPATDTVSVPPPPDANAPSDEVFDMLKDVVAQGSIMVDDARAVHVTAPTEGETVPRSPPFSFVFPPAISFRHFCTTGEFVWLHFEGLAKPLDVI